MEGDTEFWTSHIEARRRGEGMAERICTATWPDAGVAVLLGAQVDAGRSNQHRWRGEPICRPALG